MTPLIKMHTLGHDFIPSRSMPAACATRHVPLVSLLKEGGHIEARRVPSAIGASTAGVQFARAEGILPAPSRRTPSASRSTRALAAKEAGESARHPVQPMRPRSLRPVGATERYLDGTLEDYEYPREKVEAALASLPAVG
jgi:predicted alternative tryptophan synthase beta-subunit